MPKKITRKKSSSRSRRKPHTHGHFINILFPLIIAALLLISLIIHRSGVLGTATTNKSSTAVSTYTGQLFSYSYPTNSWTRKDYKDYTSEYSGLTYTNTSEHITATMRFVVVRRKESLEQRKQGLEAMNKYVKKGSPPLAVVTKTTFKGDPALIGTISGIDTDGKSYTIDKGAFQYLADISIYHSPRPNVTPTPDAASKKLIGLFDNIVNNYWKLTPVDSALVRPTYPVPSLAYSPTVTSNKDCKNHPPKDTYSVTILTSQISTQKISYIPTGSVAGLPYADFSFILCPTSNINSGTVAPFVYSKLGTTTQFNSKPFFPEESTANIVKTQTSKKTDGSVWITPTAGSFPKNSQLVLIFKMSSGLNYVYRLFTN